MGDEAIDLSALAPASHAAASDTARSQVPAPRVRWRTRVLLPGTILAMTTGLVLYAARDALRFAVPVRVAPVMVKTDVDGAAQAAGTVIVQAPGWVEADPFPIAVSALTDGIVEEVLVLEGARVEAGQVVARLVADDARIALDHAKALLGERRAALGVARATLAEAQQNWDHPIELTRRVQTAEARLAEARAALQRWPAELEREQARAVYLEAEYQRVLDLHEAGQASDIELIEARQMHAAQQAEVEAVRRREPILEAQIQSLEAETRAARENLELRIADTRALAETRAAVQRAEAAVASAQAQLDDAALHFSRIEVRSPAAGLVMERLVEPGSKLILRSDAPRSAQVLRLYDPEKLQVRVDIPLVDAAKVGVDQPAEVIVDVLPDRVFRGHVTRIVHEADVQKNTLQVKVAIEQPTAEIKPEMLARARFLGRADNAGVQPGDVGAQRIFVPEAALFERHGRPAVWLATQDSGVARLRHITRGNARIDDWIAIAEGLQPGDRVIVDAPPELDDGTRIAAREE